MPAISAPPSPGDIVRIRQRRYLVEEVVRPPMPHDASLVRMACVDDDAQGQALEVLWEMEVDAEVLTAEAWQDLATKGFDAPRIFSAYFHTLRWNCVTATNPRLFQSPFRAGIQIHAYQLEPLRKALLLPRVNLFIADDVGLGKTIEAGLIARELLLRRKVRDIVVVCPPSVLLQWKDELESRFGLTFEILDKAYIARVRQERGFAVNPWTTHTRFLVSERLLIDEQYAGPLRDWLDESKEHSHRPGSLLILDEAHHAAPSSGARYAIDSKITRVIRELAPRFEHRLFLSATPHNGHSNSFSALLEILDPQRFCRGVPVKGKSLLEAVMVRRLKEDLREVDGGFPKREVEQLTIDGLPVDAPELVLSKLLDEYREARAQRLQGESKRIQAASGLLVSGLQQRLLSSIEAFSRTLRVHCKTVARMWEESRGGNAPKAAPTGQLDLIGDGVGADDDRSTISEEDLQAEEDAQFEAATRAASGSLAAGAHQASFAREQELLKKMTDEAEAARHVPDARVRKLIDWIRTSMCPDLPAAGKSADPKKPARWNRRRVLIFTEYEDTKRYLRSQLEAVIAGSDLAEQRIEVFHGATPPAKREDIKRAFNTDPDKHPVRILIATDAAREGLNLQSHCADLFHFDVPWNPSRMEQRNGRIDRKLQPAPVVYCRYFYYAQRKEDRVLQVLVRKTKTIKEELGSLSAVLDDGLAKIMRRGIRHSEIDKQVAEIEREDLDAELKATTDAELEESRERQTDLKNQIDLLRNRLNESRKAIGLEEEHFRDAISCSLELLGAPALQSKPGDKGKSPRFDFPALDKRTGAAADWADTLDTLRAPRKRDQKPWEWRKDSPIRPIVFEAPDSMDDEVVHLHLEHRVTQRLLGRFLAQGFVHRDLSRACLAQTRDAVPRVILLGRLCLYGPGAARLHEELVPVTARWVDPAQRDQRREKLQPFAREAEAKTLDLLEESLRPDAGRAIDPQVQERLLRSAARDVHELLAHLDERGKQLAELATKRLQERGDKEASDMATILENQLKRVSTTADKFRDGQMTLNFDEQEKRQLESNRRHWGKRLQTLEQELTSEPGRIRALYEIRARRIEPVGLVYLWPISG